MSAFRKCSFCTLLGPWKKFTWIDLFHIWLELLRFPHQSYVPTFTFSSLAVLFKYKLEGVIFATTERFGLVDRLLGSGGEHSCTRRVKRLGHHLSRRPCDFFYEPQHTKYLALILQKDYSISRIDTILY